MGVLALLALILSMLQMNEGTVTVTGCCFRICAPRARPGSTTPALKLPFVGLLIWLTRGLHEPPNLISYSKDEVLYGDLTMYGYDHVCWFRPKLQLGNLDLHCDLVIVDV